MRAIIACALVSLTGCANMRYEAPPEVVRQPPPITTTEAVAEGAAAEVRDAQALHQTVPDAAAPVAASDSPTRRFSPTDLSVEEVRKLNETAAPPLDFQQRVDQAHDRVYTWMQGVVEATDHKFADKDEELKPIPAAPFRLAVYVDTIDRNDGMDVYLDADFDIALSLPNIEERLRIVITSDNVDEAPRVAGEDRNVSIGLRFSQYQTIDFDVGVKLNVPPIAFASVRWQREVQLGNWQFYPFAKLFAETKQGVGYAGAATFDRWHGRNLFRSATYGKWSSDRDEILWTQSLVFARAHEIIKPDRYGTYLKANDIGRGWGMRLLASGEDIHGTTYYEAGVFYARPTWNRWLYWYAEPLVRWDKEYNWNADPGIRVGFNMLFWDLARPAR